MNSGHTTLYAPKKPQVRTVFQHGIDRLLKDVPSISNKQFNAVRKSLRSRDPSRGRTPFVAFLTKPIIRPTAACAAKALLADMKARGQKIPPPHVPSRYLSAKGRRRFRRAGIRVDSGWRQIGQKTVDIFEQDENFWNRFAMKKTNKPKRGSRKAAADLLSPDFQPTRDPSWETLTVDQKLERIAECYRALRDETSRISNRGLKTDLLLKKHHHTNGDVVVPATYLTCLEYNSGASCEAPKPSDNYRYI